MDRQPSHPQSPPAQAPSSPFGTPHTPAPDPLPGAGCCVRHPANPAVGVCERCGDFMCATCWQLTEGRYYCHPCAFKVIQEGALEADRKPFQTGVWFVLGGAAMTLIPCMWSPVLGVIVAIIAGILLGEIGKRPQPPGRSVLLVSLGLCALGLVVQLVAFALLAYLGGMPDLP